jgi:ribosomal protein S18 acetylase RimI-like enzyme
MLEVSPFTAEHLDEAATLLAERHRRHREAEPLLPAEVDFRAELAAAFEQDGASGAVARRDGRLVGYLLGAPREEERWGKNVWIEPAGHAVQEAEDVRDLYALAAARWVADGRGRHYVLVPATDTALVDAWFRLGFGQQQSHGVREVPPDTVVRVPEGFEIREPDLADLEALIDVDLALPAHQQRSPVFSEHRRTSRQDSREEWISTLAGTEEEILIGYRDGRPVACWSICAIELSKHYSGLARSGNACYLSFAVTLPEARGSGIGVALTDACLRRARELGYETMVTDWRVTNLLASRFWPRRGFRPTFLRLYRSIP